MTTKTTATTSSKSPIGMRLHSSSSLQDVTTTNNNNIIIYTVGPLISKGAFGSVHDVLISNNNGNTTCTKKSNWVVKITSEPTTVSTNKKKLNDTTIELSHRLLYFESILYGQHYPQIGGTILPRIPRRTETNGLDYYINSINGFRCLILERMDCELYSAIPAFVQSHLKSKCIYIGPILSKLIKIVESIHHKTHVMIDIKPENIMICDSTKAGTIRNKKVAVSEAFANTIRLVDLGLLKPYMGAQGHRPNDGVNAVQGTPLYASINVHELNTPSRRDDVEAMLYVIGEIIIRMNAIVMNTDHKYNNSTTMTTYLPWSVGTSDQEVGTIKTEQVSNIKSTYYRSMPKDVAIAMKECWDEVRSYSYENKPKYDFFCSKFENLMIPIPTTPVKLASRIETNGTKSKSKPSTASHAVDSNTKKTGQRVTRSTFQSPPVLENDDDQDSNNNNYSEESPLKQRRVCRAQDDDDQMDIDDDDHVQEFDGSFHTAHPSVSESFHTTDMNIVDAAMTDEDNDDEFHDVDNAENNVCFAIHKAIITSIAPGQKGIKLVLSANGNGKSQTYFLIKEDAENIVFGSMPHPSRSDPINTVYMAVKDSKLKPSHVKLSYYSSHAVSVVDLSGGDTFFSLNQVQQSSKNVAQVNVGQVLIFGDQKLQILEVSAKDYDRRNNEKDENFVNESTRSSTFESTSKEPRRRSPRNMSQATPSKLSMQNTIPSQSFSSNINPRTNALSDEKEKVVNKKKSIKIVVEGIPDQWFLEEGGCTSYIVGSNPTLPKKNIGSGTTRLMVLPDPTLNPNHARLDFQINHGEVMVNVTDLTKRDGSVQVSNQIVKAGKSGMGFRGYGIRLASSKLQLQ